MKLIKSKIDKYVFHIKVDDEEYKYLSQFKWLLDYTNSNFTVYTRVKKNKILLCRLLTNCPGNMVVDHINGSGLDNQKKNLRVCTRSENNLNSGKPKNKTCSSKYLGVVYDDRYKKPWKAIISISNKTVLIGNFKTEIDAAKARDKVAKKTRKQFARLNFKEI